MKKQLNILIDGRTLKWGLSKGTRNGIFFVTKNVFQELTQRNNVNIHMFLPCEDANLSDQLISLIGAKSMSVVTDRDDMSSIDAFLSPLEKIPDCVKQYPNISNYTILYDVTPLIFPMYFKSGSTGWFEQLVASLNLQDFYFSISDYTKSDFLRYCPNLDSDKITTIPLSTNLPYKPNTKAKQLAAVCKKYNIPTDKKYLFSLCSLEPRKNLIRAVKTFLDFIKKNKINDLVYVLGGGAWSGFVEKLEKEVPDYQKYSDKIIRAGYVDDADLEILYSNALWFVYTSQYEGFGMPPLEAMSCGCPVITSNNTSLPEVVGGAGQMIDWDSDEQHVASYEKYYFDEKYRKSMAKKGLARSKKFSWKSAVDIILNKMNEIEKRKSNKPLVTVVTGSFNLIKNGRQETFAQTIESVQKQTYKNIEHIVIDGASTDGTIDLLKEYEKKGLIKYYSEPDKGIYDAMNKGILKAKGKYVVCLNSDDFYSDEHAIEWLVKKAEEQNADAVYADAVRVNPKTLAVINVWPGKGNFQPWKPQFPCHQTFLIKTDVMKELGLYKLKYKVCADNAFFCRLEQHNKKIAVLDRKIITFRDGGFSNDNMAVVEQDKKELLFEELGQYHNLTKDDCSNLILNRFCSLPIDDAIKLGAKLEKSEWVKQYFNILSDYHLRNIRVPDKTEINCVFNLFDVFRLFKYEQTKDFVRLKIFGITVFKIRKTLYFQKYYLFGLPIFKINNLTQKRNILQNIMFKFANKQKIFKRNKFLLVDNTFNNTAELTDSFALFEYLQAHPKYKDKSYYIINKLNAQFDEIAKKYPNNIIPVEHGRLNWCLLWKMVRAKYWIDSFQVIGSFDPDGEICNGQITTVYAQHGINYLKLGFLGDMSISPKYFNKIIFSNETERDLFKNYYGYDDKNTIIAGLSRWDLMKEKSEEKIIFVFFTFRDYLRKLSGDAIAKTRYYENVCRLLNSKKLNDLLKKHNVKLYAAVHHEMINNKTIKNTLSHINFIADKDIGEIKQKASMLITDFSSMCFDFMIKDKPVVFFHIDAGDELCKLSPDSYENDLNVESKNDELYNVFYDVDGVLNSIEYYLKHNFELEKDKKDKHSKFFAYQQDIRQHIIDGLLKSPDNIYNDVFQYDLSDLPALQYDTQIIFNNDMPMHVYGLAGAEPWGCWSVDKKCAMAFKLPNESEVVLKFDCSGYVNDLHRNLIVDVFTNNKRKTQWKFRYGKTFNAPEIKITKQDCDDNNICKIYFVVRNAKSPYKLGISNDKRSLGIGFKSLIIHKC